MRVRILEDTATVGLLLVAGEIRDVDEPLAKALIERGQAADACGSCVAEVVPEPEPEVVSEEEIEEIEEIEEPKPKKPKKAK